MTLEQLKAKAYDAIARLEAAQKEIQELNTMIGAEHRRLLGQEAAAAAPKDVTNKPAKKK